MSNFEEEYNKRLRRVAGITDDSVTVQVESGQEEGRWSGGCETCAFYMEGEPFVRIVELNSERYPFRAEKASFSDMGELIRALDEVELDG